MFLIRNKHTGQLRWADYTNRTRESDCGLNYKTEWHFSDPEEWEICEAKLEYRKADPTKAHDILNRRYPAVNMKDLDYRSKR